MKQKDSNGKFIICVEIGGDGTSSKITRLRIALHDEKFGAQCPSTIVQRQLSKASQKDIYTLQGLC
jgi:hypothetical protein